MFLAVKTILYTKRVISNSIIRNNLFYPRNIRTLLSIILFVQIKEARRRKARHLRHAKREAQAEIEKYYQVGRLAKTRFNL